MSSSVRHRSLGVLFAAALVFAACNQSEAGGAPGKSTGERLYAGRCATCHQGQGQGMGSAWPPLVASPWLIEDHETPIRIVLLGMHGPLQVRGTTFNNVMPNQGVTMSDQEIAEVLTYARGAWGNTAGAITTAEVAAVRAGLAGRSAPWTARELEALRPK